MINLLNNTLKNSLQIYYTQILKLIKMINNHQLKTKLIYFGLDII